ncbi:MAG TPA: hypothetical protein VFB36_16010 [Nevskiaceae bacterium]|nr:hypothetical protein [Nevskiaceae bacterium]
MAAVRGIAKLAFDSVAGMTDLVEGMHANIAAAPLPFDRKVRRRTRGITGLVYAAIREISHLVGEGTDHLMKIMPSDDVLSGSPAQQAWLAAINGVVGDHLEATGNPLAIPMRFVHHGAHRPTGRVLVLIHGLCMNDLQWKRNGHDHGEALARDLGYTPLYLHYNSGRHVSVNGRAFAALLEETLAHWPVPIDELCIVGHSLGGLVARSACHYALEASHAWPSKLKKIVFLGTPHHGSPLERHGNWFQAAFGISPYSAPLGALGKIRSAGVTDLRHGNLVDEDWNHGDRFYQHQDTRCHVRLPEHVTCFAAAATLGRRRGDVKDQWLGDGLVPIDSALGVHRDPERCLDFAEGNHRVWLEASHWDLLDRAGVYAQIHDWLA